MSLETVLDDIEAALKGVGLRVVREVGDLVQPPAAILSPPRFTWDGYRPEATGCVLPVVLVERADPRAMARLLERLPAVTTALHGVDDAAVINATPGTWPAGNGSDLPCYLIETEVIP